MLHLYLRPARANQDDLHAILQTHQYAVRFLCTQSPDLQDNLIKETWLNLLNTDQYRANLSALWVAEYHGEVRGFFQLDLEKAQLSALYVHPFFHNMGLGTALLQRAESMIDEMGWSMLSLYTPHYSAGFFRLNDYQSLSEAFMPLNQEVKIPCRLMRKKLSQ